MGALASGGVCVLNDDVVRSLAIPDDVIDAAAEKELQELTRRERAYRDDRPPPDVAGRTVLLVDDGLATGSTMRAAVAALRKLDPARIVVAVPVGAAESARAAARRTRWCAPACRSRFTRSASGTTISRRRRMRRSAPCSTGRRGSDLNPSRKRERRFESVAHASGSDSPSLHHRHAQIALAPQHVNGHVLVVPPCQQIHRRLADAQPLNV